MSRLAETRRWEWWLWPLLAGLVFLAVWSWSVKWSGTKVFPSPLDVEHALAALFRKNILWLHIGASLQRVGLGFGLAVIAGVPLGLVLGWYPAANQVVNPVIQLLRPISPLAWIPVSIIFFGIGEGASVFLICLASFFPIVVATAGGVSMVPEIYRRAACNFGMSPLNVLTRVIFPAALPQIIVGLRLALGIAWLVVVAAEMIAVDTGLGYLVIDARNSGKHYDQVVGAMLMIGLIGLVLDTAIRSLSRLRFVRWGFRDEY